MPCSGRSVDAQVKQNKPPGFSRLYIFRRLAVYSGSCSKHSVDMIVSNVFGWKGRSLVLDTMVTFLAAITSLPS